MADFNDTNIRLKNKSHRNGKAVVASDFALSAGFGTTASIAVDTGSTSYRGSATVTSAGTGQGASPTATLTFPEGAHRDRDGAAVTPTVMSVRTAGSQITVQLTGVASSTACVFTLQGTPVAAQTFTFVWDLCD